MKLRQRGVARIAAIVCLAGFSIGASPRAQAQTTTIGSVEPGKLGLGFTKYKAAMDAFEKQATAVDKQLFARELLDAGEGKRFDTLAQKAARTAPEEAAFQALVESGMARRANFVRINGIEKPSAEDVTLRKKLQTQAEANQAPLRTISDTLVSNLKKTNESINKQYAEQIKTAIGQVATEKKLTIVVAAEAVVWQAPTTDITDEVLARLNK